MGTADQHQLSLGFGFSRNATRSDQVRASQAGRLAGRHRRFGACHSSKRGRSNPHFPSIKGGKEKKRNTFSLSFCFRKNALPFWVAATFFLGRSLACSV